MKKLVLSLLALSLVGLAIWFAAFLWLRPSPVADLEQVAPPSVVVHGPGGKAEPVADGRAPEIAPAAAPAPDGAREVRAVDPRAAIAPDRLCVLSVRATPPAGVPADEEVEIFVVGDLPDEVNIEGELAQLTNGGERPKWLIAREIARPDGTAELPLERRRRPVGVLLRGRYTTGERELSVDVSGAVSEVVFRPRLGAWLRGRLVVPADASAEEADLARAELSLESDPMNAVGYQTDPVRNRVERETMAIADGTFEFRGVLALDKLSLSGRPEHLCAFKSEVSGLEPGRRKDVEVRLERGARVSGRVVDDAGAPVAGAKIKVRSEAVMLGFGGRVVRKGESGADGTFLLAAVAPGASMVDVEKPGYIDSTLDVVVPTSGEVDGLSLLLSTGARVAGRVTWRDGTPAAAAAVTVRFDEAGLTGMGALNSRFGANGAGVTDEQGKFAITGLGKGPFTVRASARPAAAGGDGVAAAPAENEADAADDGRPKWSARVDGVAPGTADLALVLEAPAGIAGTVVDDTGAPVAKCTVEIRRKPRNAFIPARLARQLQVRDPEGRFAAEELDAGTYLVLARDEFGVASPSVEASIPAAEGAGQVALVLPRPAIVRGRVLLPDGGPAVGAHVHRQLSIAEVQAGEQQTSGPDANTDSEGRFTLRSLPMGALTLQATKEGCAPSEGMPVVVAPAAEPAELVLQLRRGGTIQGEVFDDRGKPLAGARVMAQMPDLKYGQRWTTSDTAGRFEIAHVAAGVWQVMKFGGGAVAGDDEAKATADFVKSLKLAMATVKEGETVHVVLGAPPKDPVHVRGRVSAAGKPVSGAMVSFISGDGAKKGGMLSGLAFTSSGADGVYELDLDESGRYVVTVQKVGGQGDQQSIEYTRTIPNTPQHALDLELPVGAIAGRVVDSRGEPVSGARVSLAVDGAVRAGSITGGRFSEIRTDERGEYELTWLAPGRYVVSAGGTPFPGVPMESEPLARETKDGIEVSDGERVRLDFTLRSACVLRGVVVDASGKPVQDAGIFVRDEAGRPLERFSMTASDSAGKFAQKGLGAGRYLISARADGLATREEVQVTLKDGEETEVELKLDDGTVLVVTITGEDGSPIEASVSVRDEHGRQVNGTYSLSDLMKLMSEGGFDAKRQRIGPLPRGKYTVEATGPDGVKVVKEITLTGSPERKLTLKLGGG